MATPTRSQGVSTPRNPLTSTPNRPTASPRPNTGHLHNRPFAQKSPAVKTPASGHGHSHRISISSQPTSTPLAAPAIQDELLNLNSPAAALIASIGRTGLTPLPSGQDGLGIATGITPTPAQDPTIIRTPEMERVHRLQEVARLLETRSRGRGVTRQGIVKLAQLDKLDQQWDGDTVNIAGNSVDLEMTFDSADRDVVRDVALNLVTDDSGDPQPQETASAMLKRQLVLGDDERGAQPWKHLHDFATNLHYLGHHDRLACPTNAFKILGGLYDTFQKIWAEEKKRMRDRHEAVHVCQGNVGRPAKDVGNRLGLSSQYWVKQHEFVAATIDDVGFAESTPEIWSAVFGLEAGEPSISSNQDWLNPDVLTSSITPETLFQGTQAETPSWKDASQSKDIEATTKQEDDDAMNVDGPGDTIPTALGVQFVCDFAPTVLVPINALTELNADFQMLQMDQAKVILLQQALQGEIESAGAGPSAGSDDARWAKTISVFNKEGVESTHEHAYVLFTNGGSWCYPVTQLRCIHPSQFTAALPIIRQHVLLWTLLRTTVVDEHSKKSEVEKVSKTARATATKRSNKKAAQAKLERLLGDDRNERGRLNIDLSIDLVSDVTKIKLDVLFPAPNHKFIRVGILVQRNGILEIASILGVTSTSEDRLKRNATRVLRLSEDIGVLVQWLLRQSQTAST